MRNAGPDRPHLSGDADTANQQTHPSASPKRSSLSHRQAQRALALLLDETTEPTLSGRLRRHVDGCTRCQGDLAQLRQAEVWLLAQPVEAPQMLATQPAAWAAIQARIAAEEGAAPAANKARSNGHAPAANGHAKLTPDALVPLSFEATSDTAETSESDRFYRPLPVPQPSFPVRIAFHPFSKAGAHKALLVALAASFIVGSFAVFFLARFSPDGAPFAANQSLISMDVLNPGDETATFSFDPASRRLFALTGQMAYNICPPTASCPYLGPDCLHFAMLDVGTGQTLHTVKPACKEGSPARDSTTFTGLLDDSAQGAALLIGDNQQVTAVDNRSGAVVHKYPLACCAKEYSQPEALLDQRDQLLLTTASSGDLSVADTLVAQDAVTGQFKYQRALASSGTLDAALVSNVTGWVYLWSRCAIGSYASCVEAYQASSGQKVKSWQVSSQEIPLAADPTESFLYVRDDQPDGQSETLVVDGHSGKTVGKLPSAAEAMAINAPLHHAYLLGNDGVTVVDTRTRRKLSTLPVLARDEAWLAPAVDTATSRVYLPIQRGKLLMAQDDAAGQLRLRSAALAEVLNAEYAMSLEENKGDPALYPWELPIGPGSFAVYHPFWRGKPGDCGLGWVAARSAAEIRQQEDGRYQVQISLAWDDQFAKSLSSAPPLQSSYPHQHSWLYIVPASGPAWLSSEQGDGLSGC